MTPAFGRVTLPPFGPIRYGGPKPGAALVTPRQEDDEAPTWASIEEYVHTTPPTPEVPELPEATEPVVTEEVVVAEAAVAEPEPEPVVDDTGLFEDEAAPPPPPAVEAQESPRWLDAAPAEPVAEKPADPMPWEPVPEPMTRRPVLPLTGPNDPTPIMNQTIERTTEPHRMTPMRVTPLRPSLAISPTAIPTEPNARAVAAALEMVAGRVRRGELVVSGSMPANDDPPALAAVLAQTIAALLGVRS
jgi:hypothetical protein